MGYQKKFRLSKSDLGGDNLIWGNNLILGV